MRRVNRIDINDEKWNEMVLGNCAFRQYYLTQYLDAERNDWEALIWGDYEAIWPFFIKNYPLPQVYQPLSMQQLGPLFSNDFRPEVVSEGLKFLYSRYFRIEIKFNSSYTSSIDFIDCARMRNIELKLQNNVEVTTRCYNRNVVSNLKKAKDQKISIVKKIEFDPNSIAFFKRGRGAKLKHLSASFYLQIERIYKSFMPTYGANTYVAHLSGQPVAYLLLLKQNDRLLNLFSATSEMARGTGAMHRIVDFIVREHCESDAVLDFEGSQDENLAFFYKSFGGTERTYLHHHSGWRLPFLSTKFSQ